MKYKVTFYNDLVELLTERKANFVNKLRKITSEVTTKLANEMGRKYNVTGTIGEKIASALYKIKIYDEFSFYIKHPYDQSKLSIYFEIAPRNKLSKQIESKGACEWLMDYGKVHPCKITITIHFKSGIELYPPIILEEIQNTLVHELAHAHDEEFYNNFDNDSKLNKLVTVDEFLKYLIYFLEPTEIRSRMNELLRMAKTITSHEHKVKKEYKSHSKLIGDEVYDPGFKDYFKSEFKKPTQNKNNNELNYENLKNIIKKQFKNYLSNHIINLCIDYNIAFVRDSSDKMNNRYYKPMFQSLNKNIPSLKVLDNFVMAIRKVFDIIYENRKQLSTKNSTQIFIKILNSGLVDNAFGTYNGDELISVSKKMIEDFIKKIELS